MQPFSLPPCNRTPNRMPGVISFVRAWHNRSDPANQRRARLFRTAAGSINDSGAEGSFKAHSLSPHHPDFVHSLEPRIAPLVLALADVGCLPYTSCEGHLIDGTIYEAHVGVLNDPSLAPMPSDNVLTECTAAGLMLFRHLLRDAETGVDYETIEIYLQRSTDLSFEHYCTQVNEYVARFASGLATIRC